MNETITRFDVKQALAKNLQEVLHLYLLDLSFIPADKLHTCPMGVARKPLEFTAECAAFNDLVAKTIRGEEVAMRSPEERKAYYASFDTLEKAKGALETSVQNLSSAISSLDEADLGKTVTAPWGEPVTLYYLITIASSHIMYHDGQLNYIQSLYGDDKVHWME